MLTPPSIKRHADVLSKKMQEGTLVSWTQIQHPPKGFPTGPRMIGLVRLEDGSKIFAPLLLPPDQNPTIGMHLSPRMRLSHITEEKLRVYDVCFESLQKKEAPTEEFPGYILALYGPSGVGKTSMRAQLVSQLSFAVDVPIVTTRKAKQGDEQEYVHVEEEEFLRAMHSGDIIVATKIPSTTENRWYGYRRRDIEEILKSGKTPVVITEKGLLQGLASHFGRRSILSFGLLPPGRSKRTMLSHLLHRLRTRGRDSEESINVRIENARHDLAFCEERRDLFDDLIVNDELEDAVSRVVKQIGKMADLQIG